jgi:hypothetical protein
MTMTALHATAIEGRTLAGQLARSSPDGKTIVFLSNRAGGN